MPVNNSKETVVIQNAGAGKKFLVLLGICVTVVLVVSGLSALVS